MAWDVIVIGAGHNGLAAAITLAKSGKRVLVCERADVPGGLARGEEFHSGYSTAGTWHDTSGLRSWVIKDLALEQHGLRWSTEPAPVYIPVAGEKGFVLHQELGDQAAGWTQFQNFLSLLRNPLGAILNDPPIDLVAAAKGDVSQVWKPGLKMRRLGKKNLYESLRVPPMCVADWMREYFSNETLCAGVALPAVAHAFTGPWSPGTAGTLIHHELSAEGHAVGGPAAVVNALVSALKASSAELRTGTAVKEIQIKDGKIQGVLYENGSSEQAAAVLSSADPRSTILDLISPRNIAWQLEHRITHFRGSGTTAIMRLALSSPLTWKQKPSSPVAHARIVDTLDGLEKSFDPVKYSEYSTHPALDVFVPTVENPDLAPSGHEVVTIHAHAAPYDFPWSDASREEFSNGILEQLRNHVEAPAIVHRELLTPKDIEARYGTKQGHLLHGDHALDQLMIRPAPECAQYSTPIAGLFLGGSGSHPGGGLSGAPGVLAARALLSGPRN
jgi:phytoene dehydrogenase-like protein